MICETAMTPPYIQANTGGRLHPATEPSLTPLNRGFLYGDAIYEVWRTYHRRLFAWEEHLVRLEASAAALHLTLPLTRLQLLPEIKRTVAAFRQVVPAPGELYVRLQVWRGGGPIGLDTALADRPEFLILVQSCPGTSPEKVRDGLTLSIARTLRRNPIESLSPAWKTGNYLNNILALREARSRGADEVVMLNLQGEVTEAAVCNLGFVRGGEAITPPLAAGILAGITRKLLWEVVAPAAGVPVREETLTLADLPAMNECFLLSTTKDIAPVSAIDDMRFQVGTGTVGARLKEAFAGYARDYATRHPELEV